MKSLFILIPMAAVEIVTVFRQTGKVKELLKTDKELAAEIEKKLWENIDKLYERKKPAPKVKITEVPSANQEIKPDSADKAEKKSGAKIDVLVDD